MSRDKKARVTIISPWSLFVPYKTKRDQGEFVAQFSPYMSCTPFAEIAQGLATVTQTVSCLENESFEDKSLRLKWVQK